MAKLKGAAFSAKVKSGPTKERNPVANSSSSHTRSPSPELASIPETPQQPSLLPKTNGRTVIPNSSPLSSVPLASPTPRQPSMLSEMIASDADVEKGDDLDVYDISHAMRSSPPPLSNKYSGTYKWTGPRTRQSRSRSLKVSRDTTPTNANGFLDALNGSIKDDVSTSSSKRKRSASPEAAAEVSAPSLRQQKRLRSPKPSPIKLNEEDFHPPYMPLTTEEKQQWKGWVEVESEPIYMNTMLRELGVKGVRAEEILDLSDGILTLEPPVYGLIFLFQYQDSDWHAGTPAQVNENTDEGGDVSKVWFANQLPATNACATIALINILMNTRDVQLGKPFSFFKEDTLDLTPMERAHCINEHEHIRGVHNSFASRVDMYLADRIFAAKYKKALLAKEKRERDEEREREKVEKAAKAAEEAALFPERAAERLEAAEERKAAAAKRNKRRKGGKQNRKNRDKWCEDTESDDDKPPTSPVDDTKYDDESAFHYVAYVPVEGRIWRLDGMSASPQDVGAYDDPTMWLFYAAEHIQQRMAEFESQGAGVYFNLMALTKCPAARAREELAEKIRALVAVEEKLEAMDGHPDIRHDDSQSSVLRGPSGELDITAELLSSIPPAKISETNAEKLLLRQKELVRDQEALIATIRVQNAKEASEQLKVEKDRLDLNPMIQRVLLDLEENGVVQHLLDEYREW